MPDVSHDTTYQEEPKRLTDNINANPIPDHWEDSGFIVEDADGGIHAQWYTHKTEPLMLVEIFPCGACASSVRYVIDARIARQFRWMLSWPGFES